MVAKTGLEPATPSFQYWCSSQLSYFTTELHTHGAHGRNCTYYIHPFCGGTLLASYNVHIGCSGQIRTAS